jgi:site-specific recombinase XerD
MRTSSFANGAARPELRAYYVYLIIERGYSELTVKRYSQQLGMAETFLGGLEKDLGTATPEDLQSWLRSLTERGLETVTVYDCFAVLRGWLKYRGEVLGHDVRPFLNYLVGPKVEKNLPHPFNESQMRSVLAAIMAKPNRKHYLRDVAIYEVLYAGGLRAAELCGLCFRDLTIDEDGTGSAHIRGKGSTDRVVRLTPRAIGAVQCYLFVHRRKPDEPIFATATGNRLCAHELWAVVARWGRWAILPRPLHPHLFRHACATHLLGNQVEQGRGGEALLNVQHQLGHRQLTTTERYTHVEPRQLKRWHSRFAPARMA